jgi:hypothetical protein
MTLARLPVPPETEVAVAQWMRHHGWQVQPARWEADPELGFYVWQEPQPQQGRSHGLWIAEPMVSGLSAEGLLGVLEREAVAEEIRISFRVRIQERGVGFRISVVPRRSGEYRRVE